MIIINPYVDNRKRTVPISELPDTQFRFVLIESLPNDFKFPFISNTFLKKL